MSNTLLIAEDAELSRKLFCQALANEGYNIIDVGDAAAALEVIKSETVDVLLTDIVMPGMDGIELLTKAKNLQPGMRAIVMTAQSTPEARVAALRNKACNFLAKPFSVEELQNAVRAAMERAALCQIEVISAKPDWVEIRVPCDLAAVEPIQKLLTELHVNIPNETRECIASVFREMLNNAIEHGGGLDPTKQVEVKYIKLKRAILYSIKDPGEGFSLESVEHAAVANPADEPLRHMRVRQQKGMRPGGYGILLASQAIDELLYNEKHNELVFVKYLDEDQEQKSC
ncbi:MAG TPA: response regulator [Blastocatellia bacterium]|nr:response regulator [Blastocatellia bacterium]